MGLFVLIWNNSRDVFFSVERYKGEWMQDWVCGRERGESSNHRMSSHTIYNRAPHRQATHTLPR